MFTEPKAAKPLRDYAAARELDRVASLSAFSVTGATRRKLNQHSTLYTFADGSTMQIDATASRGSAWHPDWRGTPADIHLGPVQNLPLRINRQGA